MAQKASSADKVKILSLEAKVVELEGKLADLELECVSRDLDLMGATRRASPNKLIRSQRDRFS